MTDFIRLNPGVIEGTIQSLLEVKKMARSMEATLDGIIPLIDNPETVVELESVREAAERADHILQKIYRRNARDAFGAKGNGS